MSDIPYGMVAGAVWKYKLVPENPIYTTIDRVYEEHGILFCTYFFNNGEYEQPLRWTVDVQGFVQAYDLHDLDDPTYPGSVWVDNKEKGYKYTIIDSLPDSDSIIYHYHSLVDGTVLGKASYPISDWLTICKPKSGGITTSTVGVLL